MSSFFDSTFDKALVKLSKEAYSNLEEKKLSDHVQFTLNETPEISEYLLCPHKVGFWKLSADWSYTGTFATFMFESLKKGLKSETDLQKDLIAKEFFDVFLSRVSPLFSILRIASAKDSKTEKSLTYTTAYRRFFSHVNISDFKKKFAKALTIYQENISNPQFNGVIQPKKVSRLGDSYICLISRIEESGKFEVVSTDKKILEILKNLLDEMGQATNFKFEKVFSPEEDLFEPYFEIMVRSLDWITNDKKLIKHVLTAYGYFNDQDYLHCVTSLGRAAEDYLNQVYETYLREPIPKNLTIGQIYDTLHLKIRELTSPPKQELKPLNKIFEKIKNSDSDEAIKIILRDILESVRSDRDFYKEKFSELNRKDIKKSIFPKNIQENMDELLRNRNAASHKTRLPIGRFEALKTLYCLYSLIIWWDTEKQIIDWEDDKQVVIEKALLRVAD